VPAGGAPRAQELHDEGKATMPAITYVHPDGAAETIDADSGSTVMLTATTNDVDGIVAECGGNAMCATCHVYVEPDHLERLPAMEEDEDEMLDSTASPRQSNSRLSCQLEVTEELAGLVVRLPETQL
jgi:2Fe-2S ferredoxin